METTAAPTAQALQCTTCGKVCKNAFGLKVHTKSHEKPQGTKEVPPVAKETPSELKPAESPYNFEKYKELPGPIVQHLTESFGNWLNHFEIGQVWKEDFGGYGMYIKVPKEYSTEWKEITSPVYDNVNRKQIGERKVIQPDIRWKPIKDVAEVKKWIELVKGHIITHAYRKGIRLPATNTGIDSTKVTLEQYETNLAGVK